MINEKHILLIENNENEIEFFGDALEESGLLFPLSTQRSLSITLCVLRVLCGIYK